MPATRRPAVPKKRATRPTPLADPTKRPRKRTTGKSRVKAGIPPCPHAQLPHTITVLSLPVEVLAQVFSHLDPPTTQSLFATCKRLRDIYHAQSSYIKTVAPHNPATLLSIAQCHLQKRSKSFLAQVDGLVHNGFTAFWKTIHYPDIAKKYLRNEPVLDEFVRLVSARFPFQGIDGNIPWPENRIRDALCRFWLLQVLLWDRDAEYFLEMVCMERPGPLAPIKQQMKYWDRREAIRKITENPWDLDSYPSSLRQILKFYVHNAFGPSPTATEFNQGMKDLEFVIVCLKELLLQVDELRLASRRHSAVKYCNNLILLNGGLIRSLQIIEQEPGKMMPNIKALFLDYCWEGQNTEFCEQVFVFLMQFLKELSGDTFSGPVPEKNPLKLPLY